jgi:hypothetical protein
VDTVRRVVLVLAVTVSLAGAVASASVIQFGQTSSVTHHGRVAAIGSAPTDAKLCAISQRCASPAPNVVSGPVSLPGALAFLGAAVALLAVARRRTRNRGEHVHAVAFPSRVFRPPIASLA